MGSYSLVSVQRGYTRTNIVKKTKKHFLFVQVVKVKDTILEDHLII